MIDSEVYKEGSVTRTSNVNKMNAELAAKYKQQVAAEKQDNLISQAHQQGMREGQDMAYLDVANRLNAANQYQPVGLLDQVEADQAEPVSAFMNI